MEDCQQKENINYNDAIKEIDNIVREMQSDNCDIDKLAQNTQRAAKLIDMCLQKLARTEEEIQKILEGMNREA